MNYEDLIARAEAGDTEAGFELMEHFTCIHEAGLPIPPPVLDYFGRCFARITGEEGRAGARLEASRGVVTLAQYEALVATDGERLHGDAVARALNIYRGRGRQPKDAAVREAGDRFLAGRFRAHRERTGDSYEATLAAVRQECRTGQRRVREAWARFGDGAK